MKKAMALILCALLSLNACTLFQDEQKTAEERLALIKEAVDAQNAEQFNGMFAPNIAVNQNGFDAQTVFACFFNGLIYDATQKYGVAVSDGVEGSNYEKRLHWDRTAFDGEDGRQYEIILWECVEHWDDSRAIGLELFLFYRAEDEEAFLSWWRALEESEVPKGIYYYQASNESLLSRG